MLQEVWSFTSVKSNFFCCYLYWFSHLSFGSLCSKWFSAAIITSRSPLIWMFSMHAFKSPEKPPSFISLGTWYAVGFWSSCGTSHFDYDNLSLDYFCSSFREGESFSMLSASYLYQSCPCSVLFIYCVTSYGRQVSLGEDVAQRRSQLLPVHCYWLQSSCFVALPVWSVNAKVQQSFWRRI